MRRLLGIVATLCACLALAGCGRQAAPGAPTAGRWDRAQWDGAAWGGPQGVR